VTAIAAKPDGASRILHTSDWHLGVTCRGESRAADHDALIEEIVTIAGEAQPDLIVHTGDLFDGARPGYDDMIRALLAVRRLSEIAPVVVICGNHDSEGLLRVLAEAVGDPGSDGWDPHSPCEQRIRFLPKPCLPESGAVATYSVADGPDIRLGCLPFVHANRLIVGFDELGIANATYAEKIRLLAAEISRSVLENFDHTTQVAVWASHLHVEGARLSSERQIHVSAAYAADTAHLNAAYGYLAFGHIHRPQDLPGGRGRYAGSILEVDFGEEAEDKVIVLADLRPATYPTITPIALTSGRRLLRPRGTIEEIAAKADAIGNAICEVTVDPDPSDPEGTDLRSLAAAVRAALPRATVVGVIDARRPADITLDETNETGDEETLSTAFRNYLTSHGAGTVGTADPERVAAMFDELLTAVELGEDATVAEDVQLLALNIGDGTERAP
jgi:exonuclease SbcD